MTLPGAITALEQLQLWNPAAIGDAIAPLCQRIAEAAAGRGWHPTPATERAPHMLGITRRCIPEVGCQADDTGLQWPADLAARCWERHAVHFSIRGGVLRVAPHLYNTEEDCDRLIDALDQEMQWALC